MLLTQKRSTVIFEEDDSEDNEQPYFQRTTDTKVDLDHLQMGHHKFSSKPAYSITANEIQLGENILPTLHIHIG